MTELADTSLVIAAIQDGDALHERALAHLTKCGRLLVPASVVTELLLGARSRSTSCVQVLAACEPHFDLESKDIMLTAARALDTGRVKTVLDAIHLADAFHRGTQLHTADAALHRTGFPTTPF